ncbi:unnamed protein product [Nippostrongylus brasiliensis]|uniref:LSDAT_euk domain-containing protein n=1 Tax=Nippostrongylus brasiliensis TaxID=27835 RepID=A0A0N4XRR2_NIPBR|nr:unnamed protein product [Nippostrongylus brasiliensis]
MAGTVQKCSHGYNYSYLAIVSYSIPRIPVVVCDGSGRAADLLAFTHQAIGDDGKLSDSVRNQLVSLVEAVFNYDEKNAGRTVRQLVDCARQRNLVS